MNGIASTQVRDLLGANSGWSIAHAADLDGDGKADLIWKHTDGTYVAWLMDGVNATCSVVLRGTNNTISRGTPQSCPVSNPAADNGWTLTHIADLNGDGKADLVWRNNSDDTIAAWLMNGLAVNGKADLLGANSGWLVTHTGDFNGDGKTDLLLRQLDGRVSLWLMNGLASLEIKNISSAGTGFVVPPDAAATVEPTVVILAPNSGTISAPVTLLANVKNILGTTPPPPTNATLGANSSFAKIELFDGATLIAAFQFSTPAGDVMIDYPWLNAPSGDHIITAKVTNNEGLSITSARVAFKLRASPSVALSTPTNFVLFGTAADVLVAAAAVEPGATLSRVELFDISYGDASRNLLANFTTPPYRYRLDGAASLNRRSVIARVTDSFGSVSETEPLYIWGGQTAVFTPPYSSSSDLVNSTTYTFGGDFRLPFGSSITVNGVPAIITRDGRYIVNGLVLQAGTNTLTFTVTTPSGPTTYTRTIERTANPPSFKLQVNPVQGVAPLVSTLTIQNPGNTPFTTVQASCDNASGSFLDASFGIFTTLESLDCSYTKPGVYRPTVVIKNAAGDLIWSDRQFVVVYDPLDTYAIIRGVYFGLEERLKAGDATGAANFISEASRPAFSTFFASLGSSLTTVGNQLGQLRGISIAENHAELIVVRTTASGPTAFPIHLTRDPDGVWRIDSM
jgi:hypothetical protein